MKTIEVRIARDGAASYEIAIGCDILDRIGVLLAKALPAPRCAVVSDSCVARLYGPALIERLREMRVEADLIEFPAGEASKTMDTVVAITGRLLASGADRETALVALGGGVVGDVTGLVASLYMRSVPYFQIPTTLMAQVDSSIGGKTGVNLAAGKNLVGTFHQPRGVFIDLKFLETLPREEFDSGMAEIVKYGIIDSEQLFGTIEQRLAAVRGRDTELLLQLVEQSCRIKKGVVELDERERGLRRILNFGHTIGHAVEAESGYALSHGNAVSIGMIAATRISERMYDLPAEDRQRIENLAAELGLAHRIPAATATDGILQRLQVDKKKRAGVPHFVLLKRLGMPFLNGGVPDPLLRETLEGLRP
jgi:3-dehydroquinate synthase